MKGSLRKIRKNQYGFHIYEIGLSTTNYELNITLMLNLAIHWYQIRNSFEDRNCPVQINKISEVNLLLTETAHSLLVEFHLYDFDLT
jgi:hypothetical protein